MRAVRWAIGVGLIFTGAIAAAGTYVSPGWSQPAPTVVQVPAGANGAGGPHTEKKGETT